MPPPSKFRVQGSGAARTTAGAPDAVGGAGHCTAQLRGGIGGPGGPRRAHLHGRHGGTRSHLHPFSPPGMLQLLPRRRRPGRCAGRRPRQAVLRAYCKAARASRAASTMGREASMSRRLGAQATECPRAAWGGGGRRARDGGPVMAAGRQGKSRAGAQHRAAAGGLDGQIGRPGRRAGAPRPAAGNKRGRQQPGGACFFSAGCRCGAWVGSGGPRSGTTSTASS